MFSCEFCEISKDIFSNTSTGCFCLFKFLVWHSCFALKMNAIRCITLSQRQFRCVFINKTNKNVTFLDIKTQQAQLFVSSILRKNIGGKSFARVFPRLFTCQYLKYRLFFYIHKTFTSNSDNQNLLFHKDNLSRRN